MSGHGVVVSCSELDEYDVVSVLQVLVYPGTLASPPEWVRLRVADGGDVRVGEDVWWSEGEVWRVEERGEERTRIVYLRLAEREP